MPQQIQMGILLGNSSKSRSYLQEVRHIQDAEHSRYQPPAFLA